MGVVLPTKHKYPFSNALFTAVTTRNIYTRHNAVTPHYHTIPPTPHPLILFSMIV
jgi:hypothetical protein